MNTLIQMDHLDHYAAQNADPATNIQQPLPQYYTVGAEAQQTLSYQWWNWFMASFSRNEDYAALNIENLYGEMLSVLSAAGITPTPNEGDQLLKAITKLVDENDSVADLLAAIAEMEPRLTAVETNISNTTIALSNETDSRVSGDTNLQNQITNILAGGGIGQFRGSVLYRENLPLTQAEATTLWGSSLLVGDIATVQQDRIFPAIPEGYEASSYTVTETPSGLITTTLDQLLANPQVLQRFWSFSSLELLPHCPLYQVRNWSLYRMMDGGTSNSVYSLSALTVILMIGRSSCLSQYLPILLEYWGEHGLQTFEYTLLLRRDLARLYGNRYGSFIRPIPNCDCKAVHRTRVAMVVGKLRLSITGSATAACCGCRR